MSSEIYEHGRMIAKLGDVLAGQLQPSFAAVVARITELAERVAELEGADDARLMCEDELKLSRELTVHLSNRVSSLEAEVAWLQERLAQVT